MPNHLPPAYLDRMRALLGDDAAAFFAHYADPPDAALRANRLKIDPPELFSSLDMALDPIAWSPDGRIITASESSPGLHPYHTAGLYYIQEPAAQAVVEILDPQPGDRVLDLAAAPGGKSTHIASKIGSRGLLLANEIHPKRVWDLVKNLERWGGRSTVTTNENPERLVENMPGFFDAVLVDAPCSGEGMFRKMPEAVRDWSPEFVAGCAVRQQHILSDAAALVRPGGKLCYSTCTFAPEEDEDIVRGFLADHPEFELVSPAWIPVYSRGIGPEFVSEDAPSPVRLWPHRAPGEGHFIALFRHTGESSRPAPAAVSCSPTLEKLLPYWEAFKTEALSPDFDLPEHHLHLVKSYLYAIPREAPELAGLKSPRPGLWLGSFKKNRFEPAHPFAMALSPVEVRRVTAVEGTQAEAYLRREAVRSEGEDGWTLVALEGRFPLGWGKRVRGLVKNHYPMGLRFN